MADANDFIPKEAEVEIEKALYVDDIDNLATDEDIVNEVKKTIEDYETRFTAQRDHYIEENDGIWNLCDLWFHCGINDEGVQTEKAKGANEPDEWERAKIGTTQFYRQVTQKASNLYAVMVSRDVPFKYRPLISDGKEEPEIAEKKANKMNLLAKYTMKKDRFNRKSLEFATQVNKYGNTPILVEWHERRQRVTNEVPEFSEDDPGEIIGYKRVQTTKVVGGYPSVTILPIEGVKADVHIGDIQTQDCVVVSSIVGLSEIIQGIEDGIYREDLLEDLEKSHQWDGFSGFENGEEKALNRSDNNEDRTFSGRYLKREVFVNLPIDEDGKWDEIKNIPRRYRVTTFGNTPSDCIVARTERNQEPDDSIPIEMIHCNPDDSDLLYHISPLEVIRSNIATETTLIRQAVDNNTLVNKPAMWEVRGAVEGNNRQFGPDARFIVDSPDSLGFVNQRDISQTTVALLQYLKEDSNTANTIDKNMIGESFGARTSASEATTISANTRRPNLVNVEYILDQYLTFIAQRYMVLWNAYARHDQIVQITDENDNLMALRPREATGEYDIVVDIVNDIRDDEVKAQRMINGAQIYASNPLLSNTVDWNLLSSELSEYVFGTSKFVVAGGLEGDAKNNAMNNVKMMLEYGEYPVMSPNMDLKTHLSVYKEARTMWTGREDENNNVAVLDNVIAQVENQLNAAPQTGAQPIAQNAPEAIRGGQLLAGAQGGVI